MCECVFGGEGSECEATGGVNVSWHYEACHGGMFLWGGRASK